VLVDDFPEPAHRRIVRDALEHQSRRPVGEWSVENIAVARQVRFGSRSCAGRMLSRRPWLLHSLPWMPTSSHAERGAREFLHDSGQVTLADCLRRQASRVRHKQRLATSASTRCDGFVLFTRALSAASRA
jgi:hypothetical protein